MEIHAFTRSGTPRCLKRRYVAALAHVRSPASEIPENQTAAVSAAADIR